MGHDENEGQGDEFSDGMDWADDDYADSSDNDD